MHRRSLCLTAATGGLAALASTIVSCGKKRPAELRVIQVSVGNYPTMSPFYVALERGYFREAGIDARPQILARNAVVGLLAAGRLDVAFTSVMPALFNVAATQPNLRVVFGREKVALSCGDAGALYARPSSFPHGTGDVRQWIGKKISTGQGAGLGEFLFDTILSRSGIDSKQMPPPTRLNESQALAALLTGSIDAILHSDNAPIEAAGTGIVRDDAGRKILADLQLSHIMFGPSLLKGDVSVGARFLACYLRGLRDFESGYTPRFLKDYAAVQGGTQSILRQCRGYFSPDGAIDRESIRIARDWAISRGYTSSSGASVDALVDGRFLELAKKAEVHA